MTGAVLALFMGMVAECLVRVYRFNQQGTEKLGNMRAATVFLDRFGREMRSADKLYAPDPALPPVSNFDAVNPATQSWVFRTRTAQGLEVVGYRVEGQDKTVLRILYAPDYDPADPASQVAVQTRKVAFGCETLKLRQIDPALTNGVLFVGADLQLTTELLPLSTEVRVRSL